MSPEDSLKRFLFFWKTHDYNGMRNCTQPSWQVWIKKNISPLTWIKKRYAGIGLTEYGEPVLEKNLNDTIYAFDVDCILKIYDTKRPKVYKTIRRTLHPNVIFENGIYGVNPVSMFKGIKE